MLIHSFRNLDYDIRLFWTVISWGVAIFNITCWRHILFITFVDWRS